MEADDSLKEILTDQHFRALADRRLSPAISMFYKKK